MNIETFNRLAQKRKRASAISPEALKLKREIEAGIQLEMPKGTKAELILEEKAPEKDLKKSERNFAACLKWSKTRRDVQDKFFMGLFREKGLWENREIMRRAKDKKRLGFSLSHVRRNLKKLVEEGSIIKIKQRDLPFSPVQYKAVDGWPFAEKPLKKKNKQRAAAIARAALAKKVAAKKAEASEAQIRAAKLAFEKAAPPYKICPYCKKRPLCSWGVTCGHKRCRELRHNETKLKLAGGGKSPEQIRAQRLINLSKGQENFKKYHAIAKAAKKGDFQKAKDILGIPPEATAPKPPAAAKPEAKPRTFPPDESRYVVIDKVFYPFKGKFEFYVCQPYGKGPDEPWAVYLKSDVAKDAFIEHIEDGRRDKDAMEAVAFRGRRKFKKWINSSSRVFDFWEETAWKGI